MALNSGGTQVVNTASQKQKTVADPNASYESLVGLWAKSRAILGGQKYAKEYDAWCDTQGFTNLLIPFSPSMTQQQYAWYRSEAELPGLVSQYAKVLIGGLLRKPPQLKLPDDLPQRDEVESWLRNDFGFDNSSMISFLDDVLWEEMQTSRAWIYIDYPKVESVDLLTPEQKAALKPYPVIFNAETVINWKVGKHPTTGLYGLTQVITRAFMEETSTNEFHPDYVDTVMVHDLDESGKYRIRKYRKSTNNEQVPVVNGQLRQNYTVMANQGFLLEETYESIMINGERLEFIPFFPLNGSITPSEPMLTPLIDREIALYNKVSRINHLLYGAATYTPVVMSDMTDEDFEDVVSAGLGTWIKLRTGDDVKVLETPTEALKDMEASIKGTIDELSKMGMRMLAPESGSNTSGVSLEIRNAAQTAQLGTLNAKISQTMRSILATMINWKYGTEYTDKDIEFTLSADFNPTPLGADWLRLVTEWYENGIIPRDVFINIAKQNDILPSDYDDELGKEDIKQDEILSSPRIDAALGDMTAALRESTPRNQNRDNMDDGEEYYQKVGDKLVKVEVKGNIK